MALRITHTSATPPGQLFLRDEPKPTPSGLDNGDSHLLNDDVALPLLALHSCLSVMKTREYSVNLFAPQEIRDHHAQVLQDKQSSLTCAFWELTAGLVLALVLVALIPDAGPQV